MYFSRILFLALLLVGTMLVFASDLHAGGGNKNGNPFSNGSFFPNNGTFTGVIRGTNLGGITQFSTSSTNSLSTSQGTAFIYIYGFSFSSGVAANLDPAANTINAYFSPVAQTNGGTNINAGGFLGTLKNSFPNQTFSGDGYISYIDLALDPTGNTISQTPIKVNGVRISSSSN